MMRNLTILSALFLTLVILTGNVFGKTDDNISERTSNTYDKTATKAELVMKGRPLAGSFISLQMFV